VYDKHPVSLDEAVNVDHKKVKRIKIDKIDGQKLIIDSLYYRKNDLYYSTESLSREKIKNSEFYSTKKYHAEVKIEEDEIIRIHLPDRPKNNIYVNICGDVSFYSINYERLFKVSPH